MLALRNVSTEEASATVTSPVGFTATAGGHTHAALTGRSDAFWATEGAKAPLGRPGQPEEIASVARFLASADSSHVAGVELAVGGAAQG